MDAVATSGDWRARLRPESRLRVVNKIMDTLKRTFPVPVPESLDSLRQIAVRFEDRTFTESINQDDYLKRISMKMLTMESRTQNAGISNQMPSNPANQNSSDPGSHISQSQVQSTGQSLPNPLSNQSQARQHGLAQGLQNSIASAPVQGSANGLSQSNICSIGVNSSGQGIQQNIFPNAQREVQGRPQQQPTVFQQHPHSSNPQLYTQQSQQQHHTSKEKLAQLLQSQVQQQQQQSLLAASQMQSSQRPLMQISPSLQSSQCSPQQTQPTVMQSVLHSEHQHNQSNLLQQFPSPSLKQHPQVVLRQRQGSQTSSIHQQASSLRQHPTPISQQPALPQQQQQPLGYPSNITNMQQNQLLGQQNSIPDSQHQQCSLSGQQNNLMSMQTQPQVNMSLHQQVASQGSMSGHQQIESQKQMQHQSHPFGSQNISNVQQYQQSMHMMQPQKTVAQLQQSQQAATPLMQSQGEQPQPTPSQQQFMSQAMQLQQKLPAQQQPNSLQSGMQSMHQRIHVSGGLRSPQSTIEQQQQPHQSQKGFLDPSPNSMDPTSQIGQVVSDWQEDVYRKIQSMRDLYNAEVAKLHQAISLKCQQHDALMPPGQHSEQLENIKKMKGFLDGLLLLFQRSKNSLEPSIKEKLPSLEKQLMSVIALSRRNAVRRQAQLQFPHPAGDPQSMSQLPPSHVPPVPQHDNHGHQVSSLDAQGSVTSMQSTAVSSMQTGSVPLSTPVGGLDAQKSIMSPVLSCSNVESMQDGSLTLLQQGGMGTLHQGGARSLHQTTISGSLQTNTNTLIQSNNAVTPIISTLQPVASVLQQQHMKQEHQQHQPLMHPHQTKQQMQQQKQQILQQQPQIQQPFHQQQKQQQPFQLQAHQMMQQHQMNEMSDSKVRQGSATKLGLLHSHFPAGQRQTYPHQQLKQGASFSISSPQGLQSPSPQISQQSSPQVDQGLLSSLPKAVTPLQSTNSPYVPSPSASTPLAPSPLPGDHEKQVSGISSLSNVGNMGHQQTTVATNQGQSLAVGTPGISASPLLAEYTSSDVTQANAQAVLPGKLNAIERPIDRLVKAVQSLSPKVLSSSVSDIGSVVSMIDRIAGSAPGNGSRAAVGEDLAAMTKCRLQARNFMSQDGPGATKKMKRHSSAMPLNALLSAGYVDDNFLQSSLDLAELEPTTAASQFKRPRVEATYSLLEEIKEINLQLLDTVVGICDDADSIAAAAEGREGTVVKCSYCAVAVSPSLKSSLTSALGSPISPLRLLVPTNYPNCSPLLLDKMPDELSKESEDLSAKIKSRFGVSLRGLQQPMSLGEMAKTWDLCARKVIEEYALQYGGGSFSSRYGGWENCVTV